MKIYGLSIVKGMLYTLQHFFQSYVDDIRRLSGQTGSSIPGARTDLDDKGVCTVQYPEAKLPIGSTYERFRVIPFLIYDNKEQGQKDIRCTSCGICAKVCPPQCIWIVQETDEVGKPVPKPQEFFIDASVCMNCSLCVEFCPFDAIKMNHEQELLATTDRRKAYLYDMERLLVSAEYYGSLHPQAYAREEAARKAEEEAKKAKAAAKAAAAAQKEATPEATESERS